MIRCLYACRFTKEEALNSFNRAHTRGAKDGGDGQIMRAESHLMRSFMQCAIAKARGTPKLQDIASTGTGIAEAAN